MHGNDNGLNVKVIIIDFRDASHLAYLLSSSSEMVKQIMSFKGLFQAYHLSYICPSVRANHCSVIGQSTNATLKYESIKSKIQFSISTALFSHSLQR